ncbi:hypothetical protein ES319_A07G081100v1 [Gossypium barbadense]|uniref:Uncharacterized protein n=1 Tax=Gossypium barbadense TaxID=3634 RepID=A0A5J5V1A6_GOSBA|nr:hypothetical protein ES319_A07G081100v1 [Gossypium barbadense]
MEVHGVRLMLILLYGLYYLFKLEIVVCVDFCWRWFPYLILVSIWLWLPNLVPILLSPPPKTTQI